MVNLHQLENVPEKLDCLDTLEVILIVKRFLFKKIIEYDKRTDTKTSWRYSKYVYQR